MPVVSLLNQKGGVGKTSTCYHLAGTLARAGRRVLLVDCDPQSSLTQGFLGPAATRALDPAATIAAVLAGDAPPAELVIRSTVDPGISLVPGSRTAADCNVPRPHEADWPVQVSLRAFLDDVRDLYDLVLVDCPPNLHLCSWAALVASDALIVPLQPEDFGAQGIADVQESVARVLSGPNPALRLLGYLVTMVSSRRAIHQLYEARLRDLYGPEVFAARVPESIDFVEAIAQRKPVAKYKPRGAAAKAMAALAEEIDARLAETDHPRITTTEAA